jgi:GNAT superfamily N-acetyltransferase
VITCKNGAPITIRPSTPEDGDRLKEFIASIPESERWYLRDQTVDPETGDSGIGAADAARALPIIALRAHDGRIIAHVVLDRRDTECMRHIAHLRILVDPEYRQQRLGTWMLLDAVRTATEMGVEKLIAEFVDGVEDAAMGAAHKMDFVEFARLPDHVKGPDGKKHDLIIMLKTLRCEWCDF